jgi:CheY-specific phosphatase CheX
MPEGELVTASLAISGARTGTVAVSCSPELARRVAAAMFGTSGQVPDEDARDALREVANIVAGNFKSLVVRDRALADLVAPQPHGGSE